MEYFIADPAGNITAFVFGSPDDRVAETLLSDSSLKIEQVAFLSEPKLGGHIKCEMAGGEFCGNACRAAAYYYILKKSRVRAGEVIVEMSGTGGKPVKVKVDAEYGTAFAQMPLPRGISAIDWDGHELPAVVFDGITHVVAPYLLFESLDLSKEKMHDMCRKLNTPALGVMFLRDDNYLKPLVWVDQAGSLIWESSCGSGSTACAWWLSRDMTEGSKGYRFVQPGGELEIKIDRSLGSCIMQMGGKVKLLDQPFLRRL